MSWRTAVAGVGHREDRGLRRALRGLDEPWPGPGERGVRPARATTDRLADAGWFLLALALTGYYNGWAIATVPAPVFPDVAVAVLACALAVGGRRRWPVALAVLVGLPGAVFPQAIGAAVVTLFAVAAHRSTRATVAVCVAYVLAQVPHMALHGHPDGEPYWVSLARHVLQFAVIAAMGTAVRVNRELARSARERADRAEAEQQARVSRARHAERTRIAREMHDVLAHRISLLSTYAGALEFRRDLAPEEVARAAAVMRASAHQALQDLREVIGVLRENGEAPNVPQPTLADLPALVEESRQAGMRVELCDLVDAPKEVPGAVARAAYRVVQEGLTNVRKHAAGARASVTLLGAAGHGLTAEVRNERPAGAGTPVPGAGAGLIGLSERVDLTGGRLEYGPDDAGGFLLRARLPWPP